ncbi:MAG: Fic family protein [Deltaproteobacteria bacterium]|nr:Fic family protein [Deltaproteobacteria bacterium]
MNSFTNARLVNLSLPSGTVWMLSSIAESKGRQTIYTKQRSEVLTALVQNALIQSAESSNRIEGVTVAIDRLQPLVLGHIKPKNRSEEEIHGYRQALSLIHRDNSHLTITPKLIKKLHSLCQTGAGDAGQWKRIDNDIIEIRPGKAPRIRFKALAAKDTPAAINELCTVYQETVLAHSVLGLVATAALVLDFLCIHPFRDGNGRVSRLLTLLALYQQGYDVGRYISLERMIEESKDEYYERLYQSSHEWHEGKHNLLPFLNYFLGILRRAYNEFMQRAESMRTARGSKTALIEAAINDFPGTFTLRELAEACPGLSLELIRKILKTKSKAQEIQALGRGRGARWKKVQ